MADITSQGEGGGLGNYGWIGDTIETRRNAQHGRDTSTVTKGEGDVTMLKKILEEMTKSSSIEGMQNLFKQIFQTGFEQNMPSLLNKANTAGIRPQDATTQVLLENDLLARLTGQAAEALGKQQASAAQAAGSYASLTEKPVVTKVGGEGKISGEGSTSLADLFTGIF